MVISCRTFDLHNDPRLKKVESGRRFQLGELSDNEVRSVIEQLGHTSLTYESLSSATRELLRIPLHLDLFARAIGDGSSAAGNLAPAPTQLKSLQDLYTVLWQNVICIADPQAPPVFDREEAIAQLVAEMNRLQRTSVAKSIFSSMELSHLQSASQWLASQGILIGSGAQANTIPTTSEWSFLHQTFSIIATRRVLLRTVNPSLKPSAMATKVCLRDRKLFMCWNIFAEPIRVGI